MKVIMIQIIKKYLVLILILFSVSVFGQSNIPEPPPQGGNPTGDGTPMGEGAPIGGGITLLLAMGAAYGGKKYVDYRKKLKNEMED